MRGLRSGSGSAVPLRRFNRLPRDSAAELLRRCLPVERWVQTIVGGRPYRHLDDLFEVAREAAFPFTGAELESALAGREAPEGLALARRGEVAADARVREQLTAGFRSYQQRFGRPFLIRTEGRPPAQVLVQLWDRLGHDIDTEEETVAQQLRELALLQLAAEVST